MDEMRYLLHTKSPCLLTPLKFGFLEIGSWTQEFQLAAQAFFHLETKQPALNKAQWQDFTAFSMPGAHKKNSKMVNYRFISYYCCLQDLLLFCTEIPYYLNSHYSNIYKKTPPAYIWQNCLSPMIIDDEHHNFLLLPLSSNKIASRYFNMLCVITVFPTLSDDVSSENGKPVKKVGRSEMLWKVHSLEERLESIKYS